MASFPSGAGHEKIGEARAESRHVIGGDLVVAGDDGTVIGIARSSGASSGTAFGEIGASEADSPAPPMKKP